MIFDLWRYHQLIGLIVMSIGFAAIIARRFGPAAGCLLAYLFINSALMFQNPTETWDKLQVLIDSKAGIGFATLSILISSIAFLPSKTVQYVYKALIIFISFDALVVCFNGWGAFNAGSLDTSMIAVAIIMLLFRPQQFKSLWTLVLSTVCLIALIWQKGSTAYFVLAGGLSSYFLARANLSRNPYLLLSCIPIISLIFGLGVFTTGDQFLNPWDRFVEWKRLFEWFWSNANLVVGTGMGSFEVIGPVVQQAAGVKKVFLFMHNDWLQILFEFGILGAILTLWVCADALWRARKEPWLFATLCAFGIAMIPQFPLRFSASQILIVLLLRTALLRIDPSISQSQKETYLMNLEAAQKSSNLNAFLIAFVFIFIGATLGIVSVMVGVPS